MKKTVLGILAIAALTVVSCAKEYTCECKVTHHEVANGFGVTLDDSNTETYSHSLKGKEEDMKQACEDSGYKMSYADQIGTEHTVTSKCAIK